MCLFAAAATPASADASYLLRETVSAVACRLLPRATTIPSSLAPLAGGVTLTERTPGPLQGNLKFANARVAVHAFDALPHLRHPKLLWRIERGAALHCAEHFGSFGSSLVGKRERSASLEGLRGGLVSGWWRRVCVHRPPPPASRRSGSGLNTTSSLPRPPHCRALRSRAFRRPSPASKPSPEHPPSGWWARSPPSLSPSLSLFALCQSAIRAVSAQPPAPAASACVAALTWAALGPTWAHLCHQAGACRGPSRAAPR